MGLEAGFYVDNLLYEASLRVPSIIAKDIRELTMDDVRGFEACVHLAELSNDPLGELNPALTYEMEAFGEATGVPVLLNTSFNLRAEPIVATPENAINTLVNSGIDLLVLENCLVTKDGEAGR